MAKVLINGNEALAEAAVRAGCRSYFGYPITPQNEIPEYLSRRMPEVGGTFIQAESELAAISMVYGAAAVGELLKRHKDAVESSNVRIGELEDEIGALTSQKDDLEANLQMKDVEIADATAQIQALQSDVATRTSELESLTPGRRH